jgi:hypothetical protein
VSLLIGVYEERRKRDDYSISLIFFCRNGRHCE